MLGTIMRLRPEEVLHLLVFRHRYATKSSVMQFIELHRQWYVLHNPLLPTAHTISLISHYLSQLR